MLIAAITGRSGSGKSTLSAYYAGLGYPVADGDEISRQVTGKGSACLAQLVAAFGDDILNPDGTLDRKALAGKAFTSQEKTDLLTAITHPHILAEFLRRVEAAKAQGAKLFFIDGAVIVGGPFQPYCDKIIVLVSQTRLSVSRIILRDGISKTAANNRLSVQQTEAALRAAADYVIENNGSAEALFKQADEVLENLLAIWPQTEGETR